MSRIPRSTYHLGLRRQVGAEILQWHGLEALHALQTLQALEALKAVHTGAQRAVAGVALLCCRWPDLGPGGTLRDALRHSLGPALRPALLQRPAGRRRGRGLDGGHMLPAAHGMFGCIQRCNRQRAALPDRSASE